MTALAPRRLPSIRRHGPVVALLGPDGAGKGTIIAGLRREMPTALTVIYLGRRRRRPDEPERDRGLHGWTGVLLESAFVIRRALRSWRILFPGYLAAWRGQIVLCDRHPIETLAIRPRQTRTGAWLERLLFGRLTPKPDLVLVLDAPGETLYARKGEHSPDILESLRRRYLDAFAPLGAVVISTEQSVERSVAEASEAIRNANEARHHR
jgi:thymidylate kinase